ncbi:MAG: hypothetical protein A3G39_04240 [Deltaproteobacteria bacterium RIFCSPLOWO2_12_FULL_43_16]|nr:MAG: hypothetical protein A2Z89_05730 [Deltaproteobacteria bacterium GWA2_43_19]OGQ10136.1 MAG: hypothetical protein A3D30_09135 [Deltaproteobacteria bacterium RIFCSPHIGHO2_02_FULL_43_33]OGQ58801.1 MAG: hypothetical protein A3G39_04240 [Deltaproteobacteria bacterium RIFCSPLOWO2_12_FULL_43_16]
MSFYFILLLFYSNKTFSAVYSDQMDRDNLLIALENGYIEWQRHALEQMMERGIPRETVKEVLHSTILI